VGVDFGPYNGYWSGAEPLAVTPDPSTPDTFDVAVNTGTIFTQLGAARFTVNVTDPGTDNKTFDVGQATVTGTDSITFHPVNATAPYGISVPSLVIGTITIPGGPAVVANFGFNQVFGSIDFIEVPATIQPDLAGGDLYDVVLSNFIAPQPGQIDAQYFQYDVSGTQLLVQANFPILVTGLSADFSGLRSYVSQALGDVQTGLNQQIASNALPFIGSALENTDLAHIVTQIQSDLVQGLSNSTAEDVQGALANSLYAAGLLPGAIGPFSNYIGLTVSNSKITFDVPLVYNATTTLNLDTSLSGLPLRLNSTGNVAVGINLGWELTFGLDGTTPFLNTAPLGLEITGALPGLDLTGNLGLAQVEVRDSSSLPSSLDALFSVGVTTDSSGNAMLAPTMELDAFLNLAHYCPVERFRNR
jgi:hypothetical protein